MDKLPNFLIVGAAKSGTTTLFHLLKQHPDIFMPDFKEPLYFISNTIRNISKKDKFFRNEGFEEKFIHHKSDYAKLFESVNGEKAIGESSATYLYYFKESIPKIKKELDDPKIIIILRDPVDKAFSQYKHLKRFNAEERTFEEGLELEDQRAIENYTAMYHYKAQGLYYKQVKAFKENFSQVLVVFSNDLKIDPRSLAKNCYKYLGVDHNYNPDLMDFNVSTKRIKSRALHKALYNKRAHSIKMVLKKSFGNSFYDNYTNKYKKINFEKMSFEINKKTRISLMKYFKKDIESLEELLNEDLSNWKH